MTVVRLLLLLILALEASGKADATAESRPLFLAGRQAFQDGRLDVAITSFEAAYRLQPLPGLWFNIAQSYRRKFLVHEDVASLRHAIDGYRRYLMEAPSAPHRDEATQQLAELTPLLARMAPDALGVPAASVSAPPVATEIMIVTEVEGAQVRLDDYPPGPAPLLATVPPGPHRAIVEAAGYFPGEVKVTAVEGRLVVSEARLIPRPARLTVLGPDGATVWIDRRPTGRLPLGTQELPAGPHSLDVVARGLRPLAIDLDLARGSEKTVRAAATPTVRSRAARWLAVAAGVVGVFAASGGAVWGDADARADALYKTANSSRWTNESLSAYESDRARRDDWRLTTSVALGVTGGLALASALLYLTDWPKPPHGSSP